MDGNNSVSSSSSGNYLARSQDPINGTPLSSGKGVGSEPLSSQKSAGVGAPVAGGSATNSSVLPIQFREYSYAMVRKKLNWCFQLHKTDLHEECTKYFQLKKSIGFLVFSNIIVTIVLIPASANLLNEDLMHIKEEDRHDAQIALSVIGLILAGLAFFIGWILFILQKDSLEFGMTTFWSSVWGVQSEEDEFTYCSWWWKILCCRSCCKKKALDDRVMYSSIEIPEKRTFFQQILAFLAIRQRYFSHMYVLVFLWYFMITFARRATLPRCHHDSFYDQGYSDFLSFFGGGHCSNEESVGSHMIGNGLAMIMIPVLFFSNFSELNIVMIWCCLFKIIVLYFIMCGIVNSFYTAPLVILWAISSGYVLVDIQVRNVMIFLTNRKLREILVENERLAEEMRANEMRHMIANVAHDLKTVSDFSLSPYQSTLLQLYSVTMCDVEFFSFFQVFQGIS